MANLTGGSFKRISPEDIKVRRSSLNQLVDIIQEDISGSATRRHYAVFVTGGRGPGITSFSLSNRLRPRFLIADI